MFTDALVKDTKKLLAVCRARKIMLATAESCTGGLVASLLTETPGSSDVFERGFVTYSNVAKQALLGVTVATLKRYGAVSAEVAVAMANGALKQSKAHIALSVTGIAGPGGGTKLKPVGLVYIAVATRKGKAMVKEYRFKGGRGEIRGAAVKASLVQLTALF